MGCGGFGQRPRSITRSTAGPQNVAGEDDADSSAARHAVSRVRPDARSVPMSRFPIACLICPIAAVISVGLRWVGTTGLLAPRYAPGHVGTIPSANHHRARQVRRKALYPWHAYPGGRCTRTPRQRGVQRGNPGRLSLSRTGPHPPLLRDAFPCASGSYVALYVTSKRTLRYLPRNSRIRLTLLGELSSQRAAPARMEPHQAAFIKRYRQSHPATKARSPPGSLVPS
jgi:hypothetical protein